MIYFVRHGLSEANVKGVFAGQKDESLLTEEGCEQARTAGIQIRKKNLSVKRVISSPSVRALETARIIARELGFSESEIIVDKRIIEYDMGILSGTPWHKVSSSVLVSAEGAEDPLAFRDRILSCLKDLSGFPGDILVVSHGGVGRMLETIKERKDPKAFYDTPILPNASVTLIDWIV